MDNLSKDTIKFLENNLGKKIVFTNGCFDIIHRGHLTYLKQARELGDVLIVGLNTDESVKRLDKSPNRPINNQEDRKLLLESLKFVDCVEFFNEDTPLSIIKKIKPSVLTKGGDWKKEDVIGADFVIENGGEFVSLPFVAGHSTTSFIKSLQGLK